MTSDLTPEINDLVIVDYRKRKYVFFDNPPSISNSITENMISNRKSVKYGKVIKVEDNGNIVTIENDEGIKASLWSDEISIDISKIFLNDIMETAMSFDFMKLYLIKSDESISLFLSNQSELKDIYLCKIKDENLIAKVLINELDKFKNEDQDLLFDILKNRTFAFVSWDFIKEELTQSMVKDSLISLHIHKNII